MTTLVVEMIYLLCAIGFFLSLKLLASPKRARLGNALGAVSMVVASAMTVGQGAPAHMVWAVMALVGGSVVGAFFAYRVQMTAMPQLVALFNGFGGLASVLVAMAESWSTSLSATDPLFVFFLVTSWLSVVIGAVTFTGSGVAFLKLQELIPTKPLLAPGQRFVTVAVFLATMVGFYFLLGQHHDVTLWVLIAAAAAALGVLLSMPIGGADMPVVISLLNSYSGLAAMAAGFVVGSQLLIIAGALVGASGIILTRLMCQAMNRSLYNVIFGAFGSVSAAGAGAHDDKPIKEFQPIDVAMQLANANSVILVPGYGLAVSQAQRNLRELADELKALGVKVAYAIHPVAGRMPGHMNVLLAEADVPYGELYDLDTVNGEFESADVAIIVGANDVVNPSARTDKASPLYGMPILNADKAQSVIILKRGRGRGFAGVENQLFTLDHSHVLLGDAKASIIKVLNALKEVK